MFEIANTSSGYASTPTTVINFVSAHLELKNTLDRAQAEMDAAAKAAQGEARKKSKTAGTTV